MNGPSPLAPERTALAWRRTAAALLVLGLLLVRVAIVEGGLAARVAGSAAVLIAFAVVVTPARESTRGRPADGRRPAAVCAALAVLAITVVALALER